MITFQILSSYFLVSMMVGAGFVFGCFVMLSIIGIMIGGNRKTDKQSKHIY